MPLRPVRRTRTGDGRETVAFVVLHRHAGSLLRCAFDAGSRPC
jgi:hypothetical protein